MKEFSKEYLDKVNQELWDEFVEGERVRCEEEEKFKSEWKDKLKDLINDDVFNWLNEHDSWYPNGIVEIYNVDEKRSGYSTYQHTRIKDDKDKLLYMQTDEDEVEGINHYFVWQQTGYLGDDYSGYLLLPLSNGKYFKVSYSC